MRRKLHTTRETCARRCLKPARTLGPRRDSFAKAAALAFAIVCVMWVGASVPFARAQGNGQGIGDIAADLPRRLVLRFVTENDFPPFNFLDEDGQLTGFNVDFARAICFEAKAACDIQVKPWDELMLALRRNEADGVVAGHVVTAKALKDADFSTPYLYTPGRFAARRSVDKREITPEGLEGQRIAVIRGSAHEAFLKAFFRYSRIEVHPSSDSARDSLVDGKVDYLFDDGISLSFWLNGTASRQCCEFRGGPFLEAKYFGDGIAVAVRKGDRRTTELVNRAIVRLRESGRLEELVGRYFPYRIY